MSGFEVWMIFLQEMKGIRSIIDYFQHYYHKTSNDTLVSLPNAGVIMHVCT